MRLPRPFLFGFAFALAGWVPLSASAAPAAPFTLVAYNVRNWLGADPASSLLKPDAEKSAVVAVIAAHRPAVVGVLEIGTRADLEDLRARLGTSGLEYPYAEWSEGLDAVRHVAVLSQFPLTRNPAPSVAFDLAGQPSGVQRGILDVTLEPSPGDRLRLVGLHLKSRRPVPGIDQAALRAKEAWAVRQHLDAILAKDPGTRLLLFGDLNDTRDQPPVRTLLGPRDAPARLADLPLADSRGERWTHYFAEADEYARIDYFLASPALLPRVDRARSGIDDSPRWADASDHRALFLTLNPPLP